MGVPAALTGWACAALCLVPGSSLSVGLVVAGVP